MLHVITTDAIKLLTFFFFFFLVPQRSSFFFFLFFFFFFLGPTFGIWKFPGKGSNWSCSCQPIPQLQQHGILNALSGATDLTCILMDSSRVHYCWATTDTLEALCLNWVVCLQNLLNWNFNPQYCSMWLYLEKGPWRSNLKWSCLGGD